MRAIRRGRKNDIDRKIVARRRGHGAQIKFHRIDDCHLKKDLPGICYCQAWSWRLTEVYRRALSLIIRIYDGETGCRRIRQQQLAVIGRHGHSNVALTADTARQNWSLELIGADVENVDLRLSEPVNNIAARIV